MDNSAVTPIKPYRWRPPKRDFLNPTCMDSTKSWSNLYRLNRGNLRNFGDELNSVIFENEFNLTNLKRFNVENANVSGIGSVLHHFNNRERQIVVWGSGLRDETTTVIGKNLEILALRGKKTAHSLSAGINIALGDPALLLNEGTPKPQDYVVFAPHFSFFQNTSRKFLEELQRHGIKILYPNSDPKLAIELLRNSRLVCSSALHPLILADALGIPSARLIEKIASEPEFKFLDYLSVFGKEDKWLEISLVDLVNQKEINNLINRNEERIASVANLLVDIRKSLRQSKRGVLEKITQTY